MIPMNPTCPRCGGKHGVEVSGDGYEHDCAACGWHLICAIGPDGGEMYSEHPESCAYWEGCNCDCGDEHQCTANSADPCDNCRALDEAEADDSPGDLSLDDYLDRMVAGTLSRPGREELSRMVRTMTPLANAAWDWAESTRVLREGDDEAENYLLEQAQSYFNNTHGRRHG